eukprot:GFYU01001089.1.p1 GENE.GFYU01001089.1~~GFYU01001089.1.p1  ORF type:complete len:494 (+),score=48.52 GFYU01001089.1:2-1483(+)
MVCECEGGVMTPIRDLPDDLLLEIFSWIDRSYLYTYGRLVCRAWRDLIPHTPETHAIIKVPWPLVNSAQRGSIQATTITSVTVTQRIDWPPKWKGVPALRKELELLFQLPALRCVDVAFQVTSSSHLLQIVDTLNCLSPPSSSGGALHLHLHADSKDIFSDSEWNDTVSSALQRILSNHSTIISTLDLSGLWLGDSAVTVLAEYFLDKPLQVTTLDISSTRAPAKELNDLMSILDSTGSNLRVLRARALTGHLRHDEEELSTRIRAIGQFVMNSKTLEVLDIGCNLFTIHHANVIRAALRGNSSLHTLIMDGCLLWVPSFEAVFSGVHQHPALTSVNLSDRGIRASGVDATAFADLSRMPVLHELNLADTNIGGDAIASVINTCTSLRSITLDGEDRDRVSALCNAVEHNATLTSISISRESTHAYAHHTRTHTRTHQTSHTKTPPTHTSTCLTMRTWSTTVHHSRDQRTTAGRPLDLSPSVQQHSDALILDK